jgi:hypothetical protein
VRLAPPPRFDDLFKFTGLDWTAICAAGFNHRFQPDRSQAFRDNPSPANRARGGRLAADTPGR